MDTMNSDRSQKGVLHLDLPSAPGQDQGGADGIMKASGKKGGGGQSIPYSPKNRSTFSIQKKASPATVRASALKDRLTTPAVTQGKAKFLQFKFDENEVEQEKNTPTSMFRPNMGFDEPPLSSSKSPSVAKIDVKTIEVIRKDEGLLDLDFLEGKRLKKLIRVDISNNQIDKLDILNQFPTLKYINASNNSIIDVDLDLPNLLELDLSNNLIDTIPRLDMLSELRVLKLKGNKISKIYAKFTALFRSLQVLDLSENRIDVMSSKDVGDIISELASMKRIQEIDITKNPLLKNFPEFGRYFIRKSSSTLNLFNGDKLDPTMVLKVKNEKLNPIEKVWKDRSIATIDTSKKKKKQLNMLESMIEYLEQAQNNPMRCVEFVALASGTANEITTLDEELWDKLFINERDQDSVDEKVELYFETLQILIENNTQVQGSLISNLCYLTMVTSNQFGRKCLQELKKFLAASQSRQLQALTKRKLLTIVLPMIQHDEIHKVPIVILQGLADICQDEEELLTIFEYSCDYFASWIKQFVKYERTTDSNEDKGIALFTEAFRLISMVSHETECAKRLINENIAKPLELVFTQLLRNQNFDNKKDSIKRNCLTLLCNISQSRYIAESFLKPLSTSESLSNICIICINKMLEMYKENDQQFDSQLDSHKVVANKYYYFAGLVRLLGRLLHYADIKLIESVLEKVGVIIINYSVKDKCDPVFIWAVADFCNQILTSKAGRQSKYILEVIIESTENLIPYLSYLSDDNLFDNTSNYYYMCERADFYGGGMIIDREAIPHDGTTNKMIQQLVISLVSLIYFVCKMSQNSNSPLYDKCKEYCTDLNNNGREQILFGCLQIPNDDVKLQVVKTLDQVDVAEIEVDELTFFVRLLESYKNLGAGKTEEVLAIIFLILTKVVRDEGPAAREFIQKYSYNAIADALDIHSRNMARNLRYEVEEQEEKVTLSLSILHFLKVCSTEISLRATLVQQFAFNVLKESLRYEQQHMSDYPLPMDIENTFTGANLEYLLQTLNSQLISPESIQSYRILARIANLLQGNNESPPPIFTGDSALEEIREDNYDLFYQKLLNEVTDWESQEHMTREKWTATRNHRVEKNNLNQVHALVSQFQGIVRIVAFLQKGYKYKDVTSDRYKGTGMLEDLNKFKKELLVLLDKISKLKEMQASGNLPKRKKVPISEGIQAFLRNHEASGHGTDPISISQCMLTPPQEKESIRTGQGVIVDDTPNAKELEAMERILPSLHSHRKIQALIISALFRIIYGSIEFSVEYQKRKEAIHQLKSIELIRTITIMAARVGWAEANIAAKYLYIVKIILSDNLDTSDDIFILSLFDIFSKAISDISVIVQSKIANVQRVPLNEQSINLINNLCVTSALLCNQISQLKLQKEDVIQVQEHGLDREVTPNERINEFLMEKALPIHTVYTLIDVILLNMERYKKPETVKNRVEFMLAENSNRAISLLLSEYTNICKKAKYQILKYFNDKESFHNQHIRQSFLQDLLIQIDETRVRSQLQTYCIKNDYCTANVADKFIDIFMGECYIPETSKWEKRTYAFTTTDLYILVPPSSSPCKICPPENFCPDGPTLQYKVAFEDICLAISFKKVRRVGLIFRGIQAQKGFDFFGGDSKKQKKDKAKEKKQIITFRQFQRKDDLIQLLKKQGVHIDANPFTERVLKAQFNIHLSHYEQIIDVAILKNIGDRIVDRDEFYINKMLLVLQDDEFMIFNENPQNWPVEVTTASRDDNESMDSGSDGEDENLIMSDTQSSGGKTLGDVPKIVFTKAKEFKYSMIKKLYFESNEMPIMGMTLQGTDYCFVFGDDSAREQFKIALFSRIDKTRFGHKVDNYKI